MDSIAERIEDGRHLVGDVVGDRHDIVLRQRDIFGEGAGSLDADAARVATEMPASGAAVATMAADDVPFAGDTLAYAVFRHFLADLGHCAHEFMPGHHRHRHRLLRPLVPVPDVHVGTADRALAYLDQHVVGADLGNRHPFHPYARLRLRLDQRTHHVGHQATTPNSLPTSPKAAMARSISSVECAADICVRMRACPFGTTGNENPIT